MFAPGYFAERYFSPRYFPPASGAAPPEPTPVTAGGRGKKRKRYPRRVLIGDTQYWVDSPEEERQLLRAYVESLQEKAKAEVQTSGEDSKPARKALKLVVRARKRLAKVDERERDWVTALRAEDEEILLLLLH